MHLVNLASLTHQYRSTLASLEVRPYTIPTAFCVACLGGLEKKDKAVEGLSQAADSISLSTTLATLTTPGNQPSPTMPPCLCTHCPIIHHH